MSTYISGSTDLPLRVGVKVAVPKNPARLDVLVLFDRTSTVGSDKLAFIRDVAQTKKYIYFLCCNCNVFLNICL